MNMSIKLGEMTPGPWDFFNWNEKTGLGVGSGVRYGADGGDICYPPALGANSLRSRSQDIANMRMISATPQALYALKQIFDAVKHRDNPDVLIDLIAQTMLVHGLPALSKAGLISL